MSLAAIALIVVMLVCMIIGVPISWSLILASGASLLLDGSALSIIPQRLFTSMDAFTMLAVPLFLVAGDIMAQGSISRRMVNFADSIFGTIRGGLSVVLLVSCAIFAALTGSALATTAAIGAIMYPAMTERKYPKDYTTALLAIGGTLGPIIPPSIVFIFYAQSSNLSVMKLFMSGIIPGILCCALWSVYAIFVAKKEKLPKEGNFSWKKVGIAFKESFLALLMPVIILGGIYLGIFTATEAAAVAVVYGLCISLFVYRDIKVRDLLPMFKNTAKTTANLMILIAAANVFGYLVAYFGITTSLTALVTKLAPNAVLFMVFSGLLLILCGMFMEATAVVVILCPILHPMAMSYGIDPVMYACFMVFLLCMGIATPPFAPSMFVACGISKEPITKVTKRILPMLAIQLIVGILIAVVPFLSTFLPSLV
ncbi:TRAP transporter large permease [Jingyaoa shaoxingensis]|uniref:TRAP transporter large permease n=1 Tax=Jingyaoa shaoxingensis TaxID=2763671 RepID=A0ABR7N9D4_9FIRM|nr:TRAP transporter large permease [Jingyaoa shaoxingensis]MBC8572993.1 TRAP transporter large permease [Jingyaoa shaoxingensis]